jgi:transposase
MESYAARGVNFGRRSGVNIACQLTHVLKSGGRWIDAPPEYGPKKTLYNRYVRWASKGVWADLFRALAQVGGPPTEVLIDSSAVKAHRSASGGKPMARPVGKWIFSAG